MIDTNKRELILNAMQELLQEGKAGTASVSDIAKKAGIAKGGMYYYFRSKEEVLDALVERQYTDIINSCHALVARSDLCAIPKLALLLKSYRASQKDASLDRHLHMQQNAAIHQKSLAKILTALSPIISQIIEQGIQEDAFICEYPQEYAEFIMSVFTFLLDPGIFNWKSEQIVKKMQAFANLLANGLGTDANSFSFLWK